MKAIDLIDKNCAVYIFYSAFVSVYINSGPSIFYTNFLNNWNRNTHFKQM